MNAQEKAELRQAMMLAVIAAALLALFLLTRPWITGMGKPKPPNTKGRASQPLPAGAIVPTGALGASTPTTTTTTTSAAKSRPTTTDAAQAGITHLEDVERLILERTNLERQKEKLQSLDGDGMLRDVARGHSDDMLFRGFYDHIDPDGLDQAGRIAIQHRRLISRASGENIIRLSGHDASDPVKLADEIMYGENGWMKSSPHKKNILASEYTHLGVGVSMQGKEIRATQIFAQTIAYTDQPVPPQVASGGSFSPAATSLSGVKADKYDYWDSDRGLKAGDARPTADGKVTVASGVYKLRFYFPDGKAYLGPQIEVK